MTDRELLELAAKAAGLKIDKSPHNGGGTKNDGFDLLGNAVLDWHNNIRWNPLTDDGDALRLAVDLGLLSHPTIPHEQAIAKFTGAKSLHAATRRAIVRAATEIGRAMA
uniref:Uncharacterized protein n=1 Tax=viral metagenome TaxID=1070528 RepID=A0A6M3M7T6_9ZZZZ